MKTNYIAFALGLPLKQEERYQLLTNKCKPAASFQFPATDISGQNRSFNAKGLILSKQSDYSDEEILVGSTKKNSLSLRAQRNGQNVVYNI